MMVAIVAIVLVVNAPYWTGTFDANPLGPRGSLVTAQTIGPVGGQPTIDPNNGFVSQAIGHLAAEDWVHGHVPWWNPYQGTGAPLTGEIGSAAMFPPTLLLLASNGQLYERMLLEVLAGLGTFLLLRRLELGGWTCLAAAVAFALNGTFAWFAHSPINPVAFLPLVLLGIEHAVAATRGGRRGGWWLIAVAGALSVYAGFPETTYIDSIFALLWFLWRLGAIDGATRAAFVRRCAAGVVVGAMLTLPFLFAALAGTRNGDLAAHASSTYGSAHIPAQGLPMLLMPYVFGPILDYSGSSVNLLTIWYVVGGYLSAVLIALGLVGLVARGHRGLRIAMVVWIVLAFSRMYGEVPLLGHVLGWLPGMAHVAFFRYATPSLELAVIVLAALGTHDVSTVPGHRRRPLWAGLTTLVVLTLAALGARHLGDQLGPKYDHRHFYWLAIGWAAITVIAISGTFRLRSPSRRAMGLALVLALDAIVLFIAPEASAPRAVTVDTKPAAYLQAHIGDQRFFTLGSFQPNYGSYFALSELNINDTPIPRPFSRYIHTHLDPYAVPAQFVGFDAGGRSPLAPSTRTELLRHLDGYRQAGVAYVLDPVGQPSLPRSEFLPVARTPTTVIDRLRGARPYFTAPGCRLRAVGRTRVTADCTRATTLVRLETDVPGWHASVDGRDVAIGETDGLFQTVRLAAGSHQVSFGYEPPGIAWGITGFGLGLIALVLSAARTSRTTSRPRLRQLCARHSRVGLS
jgi:hypothetical protein